MWLPDLPHKTFRIIYFIYGTLELDYDLGEGEETGAIQRSAKSGLNVGGGFPRETLSHWASLSAVPKLD